MTHVCFVASDDCNFSIFFFLLKMNFPFKKKVKVRLLSIQRKTESQFDKVLKRREKLKLPSQGSLISDEVHKSSYDSFFMTYKTKMNKVTV